MILFLKKSFFRPNYEVFWQKKSKTLKVGKIRNYDESSGFFREKKISSVSKPSLRIWEGAKYACGSRPSCWKLTSTAGSSSADREKSHRCKQK